ncbi:hypothetical protein [Brucella intermedia]|uniref:hypothetical protein n=1 Tax=Brucella intermedia TaxID=94625 RepID=UPI00124CCA25|nr:hypothetical protein [Brucella intermedia]KAB2708292.1 hypothetical protein F9K80_14430 [Brucella intermedia]
MKLNLADVDIRVIDQRIGMGVGGLDTVIRVLHVPTGIIIEMPRLTRSQWHDRQTALDALEMALTDVPDHAGRAALRERE